MPYVAHQQRIYAIYSAMKSNTCMLCVLCPSSFYRRRLDPMQSTDIFVQRWDILGYIMTVSKKITALYVFECSKCDILKDFKLNTVIKHENIIRCCFKKSYNLYLESNNKIIRV